MDRDFVNSATIPSASANGKKPAQVISVPDSIGNAVGLISKGGRFKVSPTFFEFNAHHFYNDDGVVYEEAQC